MSEFVQQNPSIRKFARLAVVATLCCGAHPVLADGGAATERDTGYAASLDRPQLASGYRSPLGLKPSESAGAILGRGSATTELIARAAWARSIEEPSIYSITRVPAALGLRGEEQAIGVVMRGGEQWVSSVELSSAEDAMTSGRRAVLQGQLHAPLSGSIGLSAGIRLSGMQMPSYLAGGAETPYAYGYVLPAGRSDTYAQQLGYQVQLNYLYGERNTVALSYVTRRDPDQFHLGSDPAIPDGSLLSVTGEHWFSPSWALRYDIPTPDASNLIRRQGLRLGLHYRF